MKADKFKIILTGITFLLIPSIFVHANETVGITRVSGEIGWVDVQLGKVEINSETPTGPKITAYRITNNETRVTDPSDKKFFGIEDLRAGQLVSLDVVDGQEEKIVSRIIIQPALKSVLEQAYGEIFSIDLTKGTLAIEQRVRVGKYTQSRQYYFVFNPNDITLMHSQNKESIALLLKRGDVVKVDFTTRNGKQEAKNITLYSPVITRTSTTTIVTTTH